MITGLVVSAVAPYLITKFGGMAVSMLLIKFGVSRTAASAIAPKLAGLAAKLLKGHELTPEEKAAHEAYQQQTKVQEVAAHSGSKFRSV